MLDGLYLRRDTDIFIDAMSNKEFDRSSAATDQISRQIQEAKLHYDRRLLGLQQMPMHHRIVPLHLPFKMVCINVFPGESSDLSSHYTLTVQPRPSSNTADYDYQQHWAVVSGQLPLGGGD